MIKYIALLLILLAACAPQQPAAPKMEEKEDLTVPEVAISEEVVEVGGDMEVPEEVPPSPLEVTGSEIEPYTQLGCEKLLTDVEFAKECGKEVSAVVVTYRIGTRNCFVNMKDRANERLTAGITLTGYKDAETAETEFDRRLKVLKVGADKSIGERAYVPPLAMADREEMEFLRDEFIVEGGTDTRLCSKDGIIAVMRVVDSRIS